MTKNQRTKGSWWWLRSPRYNHVYGVVCYEDLDGIYEDCNGDLDGFAVDDADVSVLPAFSLNL